jgi:hypothetical protein
MKSFFFPLLMLVLLSNHGCVQPSPPAAPTYIWLMDVQSANCSSIEGFLNFENDTIRVTYIFWAEKGIMGLFIHNKLTRPLYIDWRKCSFITGITKHDYWTETVTVENTGSSISNSVSHSHDETDISGSQNTEIALNSRTDDWKHFWVPEAPIETKTVGQATTTSNMRSISHSSSEFVQSTFNYSLTRITKLERVTFIPPGTTVSIAKYFLFEGQIDIPQNQFLSKDTTIQMMRTSVEVPRHYQGRTLMVDSVMSGPTKVKYSFAQFRLETSPFSFRSFVTYSTDERFSTEAYVNNSFFIDRITQMPISTFKAKTIETPISENMWANPHSFYVYKTN